MDYTINVRGRYNLHAHLWTRERESTLCFQIYKQEPRKLPNYHCRVDKESAVASASYPELQDGILRMSSSGVPFASNFCGTKLFLRGTAHERDDELAEIRYNVPWGMCHAYKRYRELLMEYQEHLTELNNAHIVSISGHVPLPRLDKKEEI